MAHLPALIQDLGIILLTAAFTTILFRFLRQPLVLGYLVAGFLVGPYVSFFPSVTDAEGVKVWAEIGVIFLLFGLGLEFSFRKLLQSGAGGSVTAVIEVCFMVGLGYLTGTALGWSAMDSLFLGAILSISSTTIIIRALEELKMKTRGFVPFVFATLIVEDLVAILLMVLLSTVAVTRAFSGWEITISAVRLVFMMALWFVTGVYFLPVLFRLIKKFMSDETRLVISIGFCLGMVILATHLGFSPALGAFVMGSLIAETNEGKKIEHLLVPVRDLFAAVFFVSIGMLIDPAALKQYFPIIVLLTVITILGKAVSTVIGGLLSGQSLRHSVQAGMSLAQIGEFSFIIATLGLTLKITSDFLYPIAVAVSAVTTFTTPYLIRVSDPFCAWIEKKAPKSILDSLQNYRQVLVRREGRGLFTTLWRRCGLLLSLNSVVILAIHYAVRMFLAPLFEGWLDGNPLTPALLALATFAICLPFFWAILRVSESKETSSRFTAKETRGIEITIRIFVASILLGFIWYEFTGFQGAAVYMILLIPVLAILGNRGAKKMYGRIEGRFLENLESTEETAPELPKLAPWEANLTRLVLSSSSPLAGKALSESAMRKNYGVTLAMIERGGRTILAPDKDERLFPGDVLSLIGTDEQVQRLQVEIEKHEEPDLNGAQDVRLETLLVSPNSPFAGKSIRDSDLRGKLNGLVVGLEREGERILNPDAGLELRSGDLLWVVADRNRLLQLRL